MFKGQFKQDEYCYNNYFKKLEIPGTFLEIGAGNGIKHSNTYFFEKVLGWSGLCIEPRKEAYQELLENRECLCECVAVGPEKEIKAFQSISGWGEGFSGIIENYDEKHVNVIDKHIRNHPMYKNSKIIDVQVVKLQTLLEKHKLYHINFFSLDTEGGELNILKSIDWSKISIDIITVENNYNDTEIITFLSSLGYERKGRLGVDDLFVHEDYKARKQVKIQFVSKWNSVEENMLEQNVLTPKGKGRWRNLVSVKEHPDITVSLGEYEKSDISLPREPDILTGTKGYENIYHVVSNLRFFREMSENKNAWKYKFGITFNIYDQMLDLKYVPILKTKKLSCIMSKKLHTKQAKYRVKWLVDFASKYPELIDVYGRGWKEDDFPLGVYKGHIISKSDGLLSYEYSICMENAIQRNYVTEKFTDCILCWTMPIYLGCPNIDDYYPSKAFYKLETQEKLLSILKNSPTKKNIRALKHSRFLILHKYNIWETVRSLIYKPKKFCLVSGFFDIGRDKWKTKHKRSTEEYLKNIKIFLQIGVDMVIFTEKKYEHFMYKCREKSSYKTVVIPTKIQDLKVFSYWKIINNIQKNPAYIKSHPNPDAPEISEPLYNVVTCSKMDLLKRASDLFPEYDYMFWADIGYGHGKITPKKDWSPEKLFRNPDKMLFIAINDPKLASTDPVTFFRQYIDIIIGGFFGGHKEVIRKVSILYYELMESLFEKGLKDDDQFYNTILSQKYPELFRIEREKSWYAPLLY